MILKSIYNKALVYWTENEIVERETLIQICHQQIIKAWSLNPAIRYLRVETPILTPQDMWAGHMASGLFPHKTKDFALRPETTSGSIDVLHDMFPQEAQLKKVLPFCVWQVGKSFRQETHGGMKASKLRLLEFWQQEYQLFTADGTMTDYLNLALDQLCSRFGGSSVILDNIPHYSSKTIDWEIDGIEIASCSIRHDWKHGILFEVSIGLDRLMHNMTRRSINNVEHNITDIDTND